MPPGTPNETAAPAEPTGLPYRDSALSPTAPPAVSTGTRSSATWTGLAIGIVLLSVMLVFILQNLKDVRASFFWVHWKIPLGLDLLLAAVLGAGVVLCAAAVRLLQLRLQARRHVRRERHVRLEKAGRAAR